MLTFRELFQNKGQACTLCVHVEYDGFLCLEKPESVYQLMFWNKEVTQVKHSPLWLTESLWNHDYQYFFLTLCISARSINLHCYFYHNFYYCDMFEVKNQVIERYDPFHLMENYTLCNLDYIFLHTYIQFKA